MQYFLSMEQWIKLGCPDIPSEYISVADGTGFYLINFRDEDNDNIPDFLEGLTGADVILNPSQDVAWG